MSPNVQLALRPLFALQSLSRTPAWFYIGSNEGYRKLQEALQLTRVKVSIEHVLPSELSSLSARQYIVDRFHCQPSSVLEALYRAQQEGAVVLSRFSWCENFLQRFPSEFLSKADLLENCFSFPSATFQSRLKRVGDIAVASVLLIITSPLVIISAFLIKFVDQGPIFYSQIRVGLYGKPYRIWKLRSMRTDAEKLGPQWSLRSDPRVTKVGSFLRRTRLDELPQLWCVLTGSMSLIGPRPERPEFDQLLTEQLPYYETRHTIRPGLSGWAQVNYPYGASISDSANKLSYDLFYIKNYSLLLDFLILFKTMRLVFNAKGAFPVSSIDISRCP